MDLSKFLEETDFDSILSETERKAEEVPPILEDENDCDGCKI